MTYCNAGHNPPILVSGCNARRLDGGGAVLGVIEQWEYDEREIQLHAGDRLLMYTDGITESRNSTGEEFGEDRLMALAFRFESNDAAALAREALDAARHFSKGNLEDDLTVVSICVE